MKTLYSGIMRVYPYNPELIKRCDKEFLNKQLKNSHKNSSKLGGVVIVFISVLLSV
jgi:hypothetical protein